MSAQSPTLAQRRLCRHNAHRLRYQINRQADTFKQLYKHRSATERINALALNLGIERPQLRNRQAITNRNTLIYIPA